MLALGSRLGPFGTLPQHGLDYWPKSTSIVQVDAEPEMLGLVKQISVGPCADAKSAAEALTARLKGHTLAGAATRDAHLAEIRTEKAAWEEGLSAWNQERDQYSLDVIENAKEMRPGQLLRELERAIRSTRKLWA